MVLAIAVVIAYIVVFDVLLVNLVNDVQKIVIVFKLKSLLSKYSIWVCKPVINVSSGHLTVSLFFSIYLIK